MADQSWNTVKEAIEESCWEMLQSENPNLAAAVKDAVNLGATPKQLGTRFSARGYNGTVINAVINAATYLARNQQ